MRLVIGYGTIDDVPEADGLIREAADWLTQKGMQLWGPNETSYEELVRVARKGELIIGRVGDEAAACMFMHDEDRLFWPHVVPGEAFYLHRLAVKRKYAGRGFSHAMLEWAEAEARAKGRKFLRLDCEPRAKLRALYESAGYICIDKAPIQVHEHFVLRHEKSV